VVAALPADAGPDRVTQALATAKAEAVLRELDAALSADCIVIGCDSMLYRDGRLWGKPASEAAAVDGWRAMAGTSAELYSGHCLIRLRDRVVEATATDHQVTTVRFGSPSEEDLAAYAATGEPTAVAGGFTLDGYGGWFVDGVDGDPSNVIGLSLSLTRRLLERVGLSVSALWQPNSPTT
jgi:septum formation protein